MRYLKITNNGLLDIRLIGLMGGTLKANDKFKIGRFGTGLKYYLAYMFRNNLAFRITIGDKEVLVTSVIEHIADTDFEVIYINGERTSITTNMGLDWQAWMIVREIWCNALDEGGAEKEIANIVVPKAGVTCFYTQIHPLIQNVIDDWGKYFVEDITPVWENDTYKIYPGGQHLCIYKRGILIHELLDRKSIFNYDIGNAEINELREFKGNIDHAVYEIFCRTDADTIRKFLDKLDSESFEGCMDWAWFTSLGEGWKEAIGSAKVITQKTLNTLKERGSNIDEAKLIIVPQSLYKKLCEQFDGIGATYVASNVGDFHEQPSEAALITVINATNMLSVCGYHMSDELELVFGIFEDKTVHAAINRKTKKIYISNEIASRPVFDVMTTMIEENEHYATGMYDCSRGFQQHFINRYTRALLDKAGIEL